MSEFELFSIDSEELYECISNIKKKLKKYDMKYQELYKNIENIKDKFPNLRYILEDEKHIELNLEESQKLVEIINLYRDILLIEEHEIFFLGGKEAYNYFKKMDILK